MANLVGLGKLEKLVDLEKTMKSRQFNVALSIINNNKHMLEKVPIKGRVNGEYYSFLPGKEKITKAEYYPRKGFMIAQTEKSTKGSWDPNIAHSGSDHSFYDEIYYIPTQKKFISVNVNTIRGSTAGYASVHYAHKDYNGVREIKASEAKNHFNAKHLLSFLAFKDKK